MSEITETIKSIPKETTGFFKYITTFEDEQKCELMNMIQYSVLAIIPVILILRSVKALVPDEDESKGCTELSLECMLQIIFIMVMIWVTNRLIRYVPTYSQCEYGKFSPVNFIIPFLIILTTMQSKLGFKLNIMVDRAIEQWNGRSEQKAVSKEALNTNQQPNYRIAQHHPSQADYLDTSQLLPSNPQLSAMPTQQGQPAGTGTGAPREPDFNSMYSGPPTPLVDANSPGQEGFSSGPMAANEALGGGGFGAW
jgi:hypothetical protein